MKKILLSTLAVAATISVTAAEKTVTFDLSQPANYGYAAPADGAGTAVVSATPIKSGDVTITSDYKGTSETAVRFYNANGSTNLRLGADGAITISAGGANITAITWTGSNNDPSKNFTPAEGWTLNSNVASWTGSAASVSIVRTSGAIQFNTVSVTYEVKEEALSPEVNGTFQDLYVPLKFDGVNYTANDEWTNATVADGKSEVKFSTKTIDFIAVGGTTPKDVEIEPGAEFPGWQEWNDVKWDNKNTNLDDAKTLFFAFIQGTGNPVVGLNSEEITQTDEEGNVTHTGRWRASYTYYKADGSTGLPVQGLYYKFTPKKDGHLKIAVWSNKGNRNTFIVDESTMQPVKYTCEGYINGKNEADPNNEGKNRKQWLTAEDIQTIHNESGHCTREDILDEGGNVISYKVVSDNNPWVIGAGNQAFWGYLNLDIVAGKSYLLFQDSSQIGFGGFEFTDGTPTAGDLFSAEATVFPEPEPTPDAIEEIAASAAANGNTYNIAGQRVNGTTKGIVIVGGKCFVK